LEQHWRSGPWLLAKMNKGRGNREKDDQEQQGHRRPCRPYGPGWGCNGRSILQQELRVGDVVKASLRIFL
jgi:hypothetical protein